MQLIQIALSLLIGFYTAKLTKKHGLSPILGLSLCVALSLAMGAIFLKLELV